MSDVTRLRPPRARKPIVMVALLAVAACAPSQASQREAALSQRWLIGAWVPEGENCASDAGMVLGADRSWASEGTIGTWRIERDRIVLTATERHDGGPPERIVPPERHVQQVESVERDAFVARQEDGTVFRWIRCPEQPG